LHWQWFLGEQNGEVTANFNEGVLRPGFGTYTRMPLQGRFGLAVMKNTINTTLKFAEANIGDYLKLRELGISIGRHQNNKIN
jgi:hypothetical protein